MKRNVLVCCFLFVTCFSGFSQTTVISHGYTPPASDQVYGWMLDMANAIRYRLGDAVVRVYNAQSGNFDYLIGSGTQNVLIFDWMTASNNFQSGFSEDAGAALFTSLIQGYLQGDFDITTLHFIGHSRGTVVNSECAERLLVAGFPVAQTTSLDAHDWGAVSFFDDYDCNPAVWHSGVEAWQGISWADSYYQENLIELNGRPVEGTYQVFLGSIGHNAVHDWYTETILDSTRHEGYYYSINGAGYNNRPAISGTPKTPYFTFTRDGVVNGNFERGNFLNETFPGWSYNGGSGNATIDGNYLGLKSSGACNKVHNRFYIPGNALGIQFDYLIYEEDDENPFPEVDRLVVLLNNNPAMNPIMMDSTMTEWASVWMPVVNARNSIKTLEFKLVDECGGSSEISSEVRIDNIKFIIDSTASVMDFAAYCFESMVAPNPCVGNTVVQFNLPKNDKVTIKIYNLMGSEMAVLADDEYSGNSTHKVVFDASSLAAGIYIVNVRVGNSFRNHKVIVSR
ncbi:MAG TPA: T9SS type A sorting domain-containing protein [Bacteroidales bacterium]|nr:T9SS type A sorting domain-containing protein [Bacteroidales bacterium]